MTSSSSNLPAFKYHPDPVATGSIEPSTTVCACCQLERGYIYCSSFYSVVSYRRQICPWCIHDGSAAHKLGGRFVDDYPLLNAGIPDPVIDEVTQRTPGYNSWQQERWLTCCGDACEFHGDAQKAELEAIAEADLPAAFRDFEGFIPHLSKFLPHYRPGGDPAVYRFVCRHCQLVRYGVDFS